MSFTLAIVGRPNVGKSTLFNRLVGKRLALVDDRPGVTRDLREGAGRLADLRFTVIDTAGLELADDESLPARMRRLTERAVEEADVCLFVIDSRAGVTPVDEIFADILRRRAAHVLLAANKAEGRAGESGVLDAYALGLGDPIRLSAEHGEGMEDLLTALQPIADAFDAAHKEAARLAALEAAAVSELAADNDSAEAIGEEQDEAEDAIDPTRPIQIAVVGRPNAGKSTLVNRLLGEDRLLTGPEAGITRDAIGFEIDWNGRPFKVFDTAGLRKKARVHDKIEKLSVGDALRAVRFAEVVVLLLDVHSSFETQDLRIADLAAQEGRSVVIAVNKWDLEETPGGRLKELREEFERLLPQLRGAPLVAISGLTGRGLDRLQAAILAAHAAWNRRAPTSALNRWLATQVARHPPPAPSGRRLRLRYMTQAKTRPPTFVLFASRPDALPESYTRFLINGLRDDFDIPGAPIRVIVKATENPYARKAAKRKIQ
ncbi:MAG: ribosome biogenesis GTPase Der [Rhodobacteraceae bacterium]|nr:ribosome biogenesis GTPase Der [Paracoccaceae bacterium]